MIARRSANATRPPSRAQAPPPQAPFASGAGRLDPPVKLHRQRPEPSAPPCLLPSAGPSHGAALPPWPPRLPLQHQAAATSPRHGRGELPPAATGGQLRRPCLASPSASVDAASPPASPRRHRPRLRLPSVPSYPCSSSGPAVQPRRALKRLALPLPPRHPAASRLPSPWVFHQVRLQHKDMYNYADSPSMTTHGRQVPLRKIRTSTNRVRRPLPKTVE